MNIDIERIENVQTGMNGNWVVNDDNYNQIMRVVNNTQDSFTANAEIKIIYIYIN